MFLAVVVVFGLLAAVSLLAQPGAAAPPAHDDPRATRTPEPTHTHRPTRTPRPTHTPAPTKTPEPTPTATATRRPTRTPGATTTGSPVPSATSTTAPRPTADPNPTAAPGGGCQLYAGAGLPLAIPDNSPNGTSARLNVTGFNQPLGRVVVRLDYLQHPFASDLIIDLVAPDGTRVLLANRVGSDTDDFYRTVLTDEAATALYLAPPPRTGAYLPEEPLTSLSGRLAGGAWTLLVADVVGGDLGTLHAWTLELCPGDLSSDPDRPVALFLPFVVR